MKTLIILVSFGIGILVSWYFIPAHKTITNTVTTTVTLLQEREDCNQKQGELMLVNNLDGSPLFVCAKQSDIIYTL